MTLENKSITSWTPEQNATIDGLQQKLGWSRVQAIHKLRQGRVARTINPKNEFGCPTTPVLRVGLLTFQTFKRATCKLFNALRIHSNDTHKIT